jgi:hypothetical protein
MPGGKTIAHGFLTLSLIPMLNHQISHINNVRNGINYGCNKVRFTSPVPAGSRVRAAPSCRRRSDGRRRRAADQPGDHRDRGTGAPACVAETMSIVYGTLSGVGVAQARRTDAGAIEQIVRDARKAGYDFFLTPSSARPASRGAGQRYAPGDEAWCSPTAR